MMPRKLDFAKLLGFELLGIETLGDLELSALDFRNDTIAARLGAKVGEPSHPRLAGESVASGRRLNTASSR